MLDFLCFFEPAVRQISPRRSWSQGNGLVVTAIALSEIQNPIVHYETCDQNLRLSGNNFLERVALINALAVIAIDDCIHDWDTGLSSSWTVFAVTARGTGVDLSTIGCARSGPTFSVSRSTGLD